MPASPVQERGETQEEDSRRVWYRRKSTPAKGKEVLVDEVEEEEVFSEEDGAPLCREAEIEKWKGEVESEGDARKRNIARRYTFH